MSRSELVQRNRASVLTAAARHGAHNVRIFGSVARGEDDQSSDIDLLVDLEPGRSLLDLGGLVMDLRELLGCSVDVVTEAGLRPRLRERVIKEALPL
ncbi:MAG: nucleotidyltransferase family protein [Planctomycetaceae bacterium]